MLRRNPKHVGANHYYIHAVEASPHPERALPSAERLPKLVPSAGHLVHMPAHIYMRTGDYEASAQANADAARVDEAYIKANDVRGVYPVMYYNHNLDFLAAAASMAGRYGDAKRASLKAAANAAAVVKDMPMAEFLVPRPFLVDVRFQRWQAVLQAPEPPESMPTTRAVWHYARGVALAAKGDVAGAEEERWSLEDEVMKVPNDAIWGLNQTKAVLAIARSSLDARIDAAKKDSRAAISAWRVAVAVQDSLAYDEPPPWYYPVRESLGAALFLDGQKEEAEKTFREDLDRNPRNPRSLFGLWECLKAQKKTADAEWMPQRLSGRVEELRGRRSDGGSLAARPGRSACRRSSPDPRRSWRRARVPSARARGGRSRGCRSRRDPHRGRPVSSTKRSRLRSRGISNRPAEISRAGRSRISAQRRASPPGSPDWSSAAVIASTTSRRT